MRAPAGLSGRAVVSGIKGDETCCVAGRCCYSDDVQAQGEQGMSADWRNELGSIFGKPDPGKKEDPANAELQRFMTEVVVPALEELSQELERHGRQATVRASETSAALMVAQDGEEEMTYRLQGRMFPGGVLPYADVRYRERKGLRLLRSESMLRSGNTSYTLRDVTREEIIRHFLDQYKRRVLADKA